MALLIAPDATARVIPKNLKSVEFMLERWPYHYQLDTILGSNGKKYMFDIYVDEEGLMKQLPVNRLASYFAHPLADIRFPCLIQGPAVVVPLQKNVNYTMSDFEAIRGGVVGDYSEDDSAEEECLADTNSHGKLASAVRL